MHPDLKIIQNSLEELESLQGNSFLKEAYDELVEFNAQQRWPLDLANYRNTSVTLRQATDADPAWLYLQEASRDFNIYFQKQDLSVYFRLNQKILGLQAPQIRKIILSEHYPFPKPEALQEGFEMIQDFIFRKNYHPFFARLSFVQNLNSLHPFSDGNGRTSRFLLEHWLIQMSLPPLHCRAEIDFLTANPTNQIHFTLESFVISTLLSMKRSIEEKESV